MKELFDHVSLKTSMLTTRSYSTSFSLGIFCLDKSIRPSIYSIYGFVRFADEIVDSFHGYNKGELLKRFADDTYLAISEGISLNPILNSFQKTVNEYSIPSALIDSFLKSMEMDLTDTDHSPSSYQEYILGSAEVVGLMCLKVFVNGDVNQYEKLKPSAMRLGAAFQKVNFLRDLKQDFSELGRSYFPNVDLNKFDESIKKEIEKEIDEDFQSALKGIKLLPLSSRFGVYVAYIYYQTLFKKIKNTAAERIMKSRIRIPNSKKASLLAYSFVKYQLKRI
jgi:phytoene/squalene synthetase